MTEGYINIYHLPHYKPENDNRRQLHNPMLTRNIFPHIKKTFFSLSAWNTNRRVFLAIKQKANNTTS